MSKSLQPPTAHPPGASQPSPPPSPQPLALSDKQYLVSDNQVLVSVFVNLILGGLCIFGFVVLRGWVRGPGGVFQRRQELQDLFMRPPRLVLGTVRQVWNWIMPLLAVSDADIVSCSGFDALVLTRVLLIGLQMFTVMTLLGMIVLIPVYYTRGGVHQSSASLGTLARLSVANIPTGSVLFVLPFCMNYVFIGYGCWVMLINCKCYAQLRMAYFCCLDALPPTLQPELAADTPAATAATAATVGSSSRGSRKRSHSSHGDGAGDVGPITALNAGGFLEMQTLQPLEGAGGRDQQLQQQQQFRTLSNNHSQHNQAERTGLMPMAQAVAAVTTPQPVAEASQLMEVVEEGVEQQQQEEEEEAPRQSGGSATAAAAAAAPLAMARTGSTGNTDDRAQGASGGGGGGGGDHSLLQPCHREEEEAEGEEEEEGEEAGGNVLMTPRMSLRSTWVNMANFFNPTLRMMLDYLDWQKPLQRTAARFGVRDLQLPTVTTDEAPRGARLYGANEPLVWYDDMVSTLRCADVASCTADELGSDGGNDKGKARESGEGNAASGTVSATASADVVLPYWRPLQALGLMREAGPLRAGCESRGSSLKRHSSSMARRLRRDPMSTCTSQVDSRAAVVASSGNTEKGATASTVAAGASWTFAPLRYSLRHGSTEMAPHAEAAAPPPPSATMAVSVEGTGTATAGSYGMADPRQPLLPGKRNVRLLQLLQVPMRVRRGDVAAAREGNAGGGSGYKAHLRCPTMRHSVYGDAENATADVDPIRLVNANHYVVLIKRVHLKRGPGIIDRMAALTYIAVNRIRRAATWAATGSAAEHVATSAMTYRTNNRLRTTAAADADVSDVGADASHPAGMCHISRRPVVGANCELSCGREVKFATAGASSSSPSFQPDANDVEAQAVAAAAAAAVPPLRGLERIEYDVRRYFEMFEDSGSRQFDPLKDVRAADTRGKLRKASARRTTATTGESGGSGGSGGSSTSAVVAEPLPAKHLTTSTSGGSDTGAANIVTAAMAAATATATAATATAEEEKARTDADLDPKGAAVAAVLRDLFPKTFQGLIPVTNHDGVDKLLYRWDAKMLALACVVRDLERLEARQHRRRRHHQLDDHDRGADVEDGIMVNKMSESTVPAASRTTLTSGSGSSSRWFRSCCSSAGSFCFSCNCSTDGAAAATSSSADMNLEMLRAQRAKLKTEIGDLEKQIASKRGQSLLRPVGTAYFAMFSNSQDAQMLGQCRRVVPPQGPGTLLSFDAVPAPAPDDVSWPALWSTGSLEQMLRRMAVVLPMAVIFVLPIGPLQGALASLDVSLCGGTTTFEGITTNKLYVDWFCEPKNVGVRLWKSLVTGILPSLLGLLWTSLIMPQLLYLCSSLSRSEVSLSGQERQMQNWFFWYSLINTFLGAVLGSGVFSQLGAYLADPRKLLDKIGSALPSTANFFVQFCIARALFSNFVRMLWPHAGSMLASIFRPLFRLGVPRSLHAAALVHMPPSSRAVSYYNAILQVFMFGCAFSSVAPVILPCCWLFFLTGFLAYRYSILYVYERNYESGGRMWPVLFDQVMGVMVLMELFSGAVFIVNKAWVFAIVTWVTLTPPLLIFWRYCSRHFLEPVHFPPLSVVASEPRGVRLSPLIYTPPALRPGALGWYPEKGKVWEKYGIPKHW